MKTWLVLALLYLTAFCAWSQQTPSELSPETATNADGVKVIWDIPYKSGGSLNDYEKERCKLDLYLPAGKKGFATLVWFHGGGLEIGNKRDGAAMAQSLARAGVAVVCAEYRLSPKAKYPSYVQDAAAAFAWTRTHIADYSGDTKKLFIGGHSAGAWLALMVGLDGRYLGAFEVNPAAIAGVISVSGQTMTHYTVRKERGIGRFTITADEAAPVYYIRKETPPILMLYADHDMTARAEEGEFFVAMMKGVGNPNITGQLIVNRDHNSIAAHIVDEGDPARAAILDFIKSPSRK